MLRLVLRTLLGLGLMLFDVIGCCWRNGLFVTIYLVFAVWIVALCVNFVFTLVVVFLVLVFVVG